MAGLRLLQEIGANARYFTDASQKPPIDVADGDCAAGMCIDFYGNQQQEALRRRGDWGRVGFVSPPGGTAYSVDPVAILRGARNRAAAEAFQVIEAPTQGVLVPYGEAGRDLAADQTTPREQAAQAEEGRLVLID